MDFNRGQRGSGKDAGPFSAIASTALARTKDLESTTAFTLIAPDTGDDPGELRYWHELLQEISRSASPVVVDLARTERMLSEIDAFILAIELETLDDLRSKQVAFVTGNQGGCHFLVECARNRGYSWSVFDTLDDAAVWLHKPESVVG
ncbi:MAG: hypothetical protein KJO54_03930 [Gammaproteobacteria bacterium]|nr:hypothetical protein [Gammaproteobacteria bacterium]NNF59712.1 hypothetical protein [Gammaproteobacteria bacterium]